MKSLARRYPLRRIEILKAETGEIRRNANFPGLILSCLWFRAVQQVVIGGLQRFRQGPKLIIRDKAFPAFDAKNRQVGAFQPHELSFFSQCPLTQPLIYPEQTDSLPDDVFGFAGPISFHACPTFRNSHAAFLFLPQEIRKQQVIFSSAGAVPEAQFKAPLGIGEHQCLFTAKVAQLRLLHGLHGEAELP